MKIYTLIVTSILVLLTGVMIYHMLTMKSATNQLIVSQQKSVKTFDKSILPLLEEIELNLQILFLILLIIVFIIIFGLYFIKSRRVLYAYDSLTDNIKEKTHEMESQKEELRLKKVLEQQNKQFLKAQKVANIGFWELDLVENKLVWSDAIYRIFELDPKKFDSSFENFLQMIHPEDRDKVNLAYSNSLETKEPYSIKHRLLMDDGRIKWVIEECDTEFDEAGNPLISLGVVQDITADIQYQQQLFEKSEQFSIITKMASAAIYMTDVSGKCTYVNDLWLKFAGMKKEEAFGEGWKQAIFEEDQEQVFSSWDKMIASQGTWGLEYRFVTKENVVTWIYGTANAIKDKDGKVTGYIGVNMDITELKEKEKQLFQQASLAQIGELLGNIAHQWRQPLSAITGTTTLLELKMLMTDTFDKKLLTESIEKINEHTQYLSGTINDFRNFFLTNNSGNIEKVDLKESLE
ncbi:MAG: PAS domain-containing protein, partial [Thiovulaceae bacterium]|nr:PAS domain-containing protein [Sulfurimonadaceae bacterium]